MPRDGSQIYHRPPGTDGIPDTTIESTKYNINVADVEQDLNLPRPIIAGGTGANNAHDAMINLSGEIASQLVTNYNSFPFVSGSFASAGGATSEPVAGVGAHGIAIVNGPYVTLEAFADNDLTGRMYVRKKTGTWQPWMVGSGTQADDDARYVNVAGDTMTGALTVPGNVTITDSFQPTIRGIKPAGPRWDIYAGDGVTETGGNAGSNFTVWRYDDANQPHGSFSVSRANGDARFENALYAVDIHAQAGSLISDHDLYLGYTGGNSAVFFKANGSVTLAYDGINLNLNGTNLVVAGNISAPSGTLYAVNITATGTVSASANVLVGQGSAAASSVYFSNTAGALHYDGSANFYFSGGIVNCHSNITTEGSVIATGPVGSIYNLDAVSNAVTAADGAIITIISNFSGMVLLTGHTSGITELWLCGAGNATRIGISVGPGIVTAAAAPPQGGYVFYNNSGATSAFGVIVFRTRPGY